MLSRIRSVFLSFLFRIRRHTASSIESLITYLTPTPSTPAWVDTLRAGGFPKPSTIKPAAIGSKPRVTLVIPTYNRSHFLARQLEYLSRHFDPTFYRILVLDGSRDEAERAENLRISESRGVVCRWYDSGVYSGYDRMIAGMAEVDTEFAQFMPDDDYFCEPTMRRHVTMLEENPTAVGAYGHSIEFDTVFNKLGEPMHARLWLCQEHNATDDAFEHPIERLFYAFFEKSRSAYFCLYRSEILLRALKGAKKAGVLNLEHDDGTEIADTEFFYFGDLAMTAIPLIIGKKLNSHLPMLAYQVGNSVNASTANEDKAAGPVRRTHHMLPLDESYRFLTRAKMLIDTIVEEYEQEHATGKPEVLSEFFAELLIAFLGSVSTSGLSLQTMYNRTLGELGGSRQSMLSMWTKLTLPHMPFDINHGVPQCKVCVANGLTTCQDVRASYGFLISEVPRIMGADRVKIVEKGPTEVEMAEVLYSRQRPVYGTIGRNLAENQLPDKFFIRVLKSIARRVAPTKAKVRAKS